MDDRVLKDYLTHGELIDLQKQVRKQLFELRLLRILCAAGWSLATILIYRVFTL